MAPTLQTTMRTSYGASPSGVVKKLNIVEMIDLLTPTETPFLSYLGWAKEAEGGPRVGADSLSIPCTQQIYQWQNDELVPITGTIATETNLHKAVAGSVTATMTTDHGKRFAVGDVVTINDATGVGYVPNTYWVSAVDVGADPAEVTFTWIAGALITALTGSTVTKIGNTYPAGADAPTRYRSTSISQTSNFTQIWMEVCKVADELQATEVYGISDQMGYQVQKKFKELVIQLEGACIYGQKATVNTDRYTMGGLAYFIRDDATAQANLLSVSAAGGALTEGLFNTLLESIWKQGGKPDTCFVNSTQKRYMNAWLTPYVRTTKDDHVAGILTDQYQSDFGTINIVLNRNVAQGDLIVCTSDLLGVGPLKGNGKDLSFSLEMLPRVGIATAAMISGDYTLEVRNNTQAHGWIYGLATS